MSDEVIDTISTLVNRLLQEEELQFIVQEELPHNHLSFSEIQQHILSNVTKELKARNLNPLESQQSKAEDANFKFILRNFNMMQ